MIPLPRASLFGDCPHCGKQSDACPDPGTCALCTCTSCIRRRATDELVARNRARLVGQGTVQERVADDRATYGGGPVIMSTPLPANGSLADIAERMGVHVLGRLERERAEERDAQDRMPMGG